MMGVPLQVLIVEDSADDAELIRIELEKGGFDLTWQRVETEESFVQAFRREEWDLVISDFKMPQFNGLRAFSLFKSFELDIPFIFVSGALGEERAVQAMRAGARDYLLKGNLARLSVAVERELEEARNRRNQRAAQEAARREQRRLATAVQASGVGVFEYALPPGQERYLSDRWCEILGYHRDEIPDRDDFLEWLFRQMHPDDLDGVRRAFDDFIEGRTQRFQTEIRIQHKDRRWISVLAFANAVERDPGGRAKQIVGVILDLTERKRLEDQLRQAQKMEAVGRLAGGVAHDFNNLLTVIFSFGRFVLEELPAEEPAHKDMQEVLAAAGKAESLTGQLLAFSRRKTISPRVVNLTQTIQGIDKMLRRLLGEDVEFLTRLAPDLWKVRADPDAFEQVVVNLAVNARDAMPDGGKLTLETANASLNGDYVRAHGDAIPAGNYVMVAMSDTGIGIDAETQAKIFEPFFSTKPPGKGTGLGLSTCYGIIKQCGGYIWAYSEPGQGTTFRVYLPRVAGEPDRPVERREPTNLRGAERILLVEDDDQVRKLAVRALSRLGYQVLKSASGADALRQAEETDQRIDLLLTDVIMPGLGGKELAEQLAAMRPGIKVLYMSGYTENAVVQRGILSSGTQMLQKPFAPQDLAQKVRSVLDDDREED